MFTGTEVGRQDEDAMSCIESEVLYCKPNVVPLGSMALNDNHRRLAAPSADGRRSRMEDVNIPS